jgi:hypothetical protein
MQDTWKLKALDTLFNLNGTCKFTKSIACNSLLPSPIVTNDIELPLLCCINVIPQQCDVHIHITPSQEWELTLSSMPFQVSNQSIVCSTKWNPKSECCTLSNSLSYIVWWVEYGYHYFKWNYDKYEVKVVLRILKVPDIKQVPGFANFTSNY